MSLVVLGLILIVIGLIAGGVGYGYRTRMAWAPGIGGALFIIGLILLILGVLNVPL